MAGIAQPGPQDRYLVAPTGRSGSMLSHAIGGPKDRHIWCRTFGAQDRSADLNPVLPDGAIQCRLFEPHFARQLTNTIATSPLVGHLFTVRTKPSRFVRSLHLSHLVVTAFSAGPLYFFIKSIALSANLNKCGCARLPLVRIANPNL